MIKKTKSEEWKPFQFKGYKVMRNKYAISSYGRIASFKSDLYKDGRILKGSATAGYKTFNLHNENESKTLYIHREVARLFLKNKSPKEKLVIHLNHDKSDNRVKNLRWVTLQQSIAHQQKSPARIAFVEKQQNRKKGLKLTVSQVKSIKDQLSNPRRRLTNRQLAQKYDVSEMTIYRIKRGENWQRV